MSDHDTETTDSTGTTRRSFIYMGGAGALTLLLPKEWTAPIVELVATPAMAQDTVYLADIFRRSMGDPEENNVDNSDDKQTTTTNGPGTTPAPTTTKGPGTTPAPTTTKGTGTTPAPRTTPAATTTPTPTTTPAPTTSGVFRGPS